MLIGIIIVHQRSPKLATGSLKFTTMAQLAITISSVHRQSTNCCTHCQRVNDYRLQHDTSTNQPIIGIQTYLRDNFHTNSHIESNSLKPIKTTPHIASVYN